MLNLLLCTVIALHIRIRAANPATHRFLVVRHVRGDQRQEVRPDQRAAGDVHERLVARDLLEDHRRALAVRAVWALRARIQGARMDPHLRVWGGLYLKRPSSMKMERNLHGVQSAQAAGRVTDSI